MDLELKQNAPTSTRLLLLHIKKQIVKSYVAVLSLVMITGVILVGLFAFSRLKFISASILSRDVVATAELPVYTGFLSTLGILGWTVAVAVCLLGYFLVARENRQHIFLLSSAAISAILGLDDMLLLHEEVLPRIIPNAEMLIYALYVGQILLFLWVYRENILKTEYLLLLCGLTFFAVSMSIDQIIPDIATFVEDGFKFIGIAFWMTYFFRTSMRMIKANMATQNN